MRRIFDYYSMFLIKIKGWLVSVSELDTHPAYIIPESETYLPLGRLG
jgi:hypothetical protein